MLKRLELVGFKSFADKTIFEFGDGVTGIVGPNGSGKSNIVDAVRWIMGEQSAKSLRGGEMADVIFNGSTSRKSLGLAEVSMIFDNSKRQLGIELDEVQLTRRVYRTGEGEYLINGQLSRLKDIKELFLGSGAGNDAYCIIEQGRVDVLLQASTKDRRTIFEEAAGISRFKSKKIETQRKLEKVDQNLQRLKDIVEEVEKQHRSVKLQASKAQRYQEYSDRLKELRIQLGLEEYHTIHTKLENESQTLESLKVELEQRAGRAGACEAESGRLEMVLADLEDSLREREGQLARVMQQISAEESTLQHESTMTSDLEKELERTRRQLSELAEHITQLASSVGAAEVELAEAESQAGSQRQLAKDQEQNLRETSERLGLLQRQIAADQNEHLELMRRSAHLQNDATAAKAQVDNLCRERDRLHHRSEVAAENLASIDVELVELTKADEILQNRVTQARQDLVEQRAERERLRQAREKTAEFISQLRQERSGIASRIEVLEGLIRSQEGLGAGVREVLSLIETNPTGPWSTIVGMIADFLTVKREYAPLIDLALGDWAQRFLVRDLGQLAQALQQREQPFAGRVSFLPLDPERTNTPEYGRLRENRLVELSLLSRVRKRPGTEIDPEHPGLVAPAVQVVACDHPDLADLPEQLLGRTLLVRDLATARAIAEHTEGFRLVTLQGELLEPDGTLTVGAHHAETGILARKSELLDLRAQLQRLDVRIRDLEHDATDLKERLDRIDSDLREKQEEIDVLAEQSADLRNRLQRHQDKRQGLHEEVSLSRDEIGRLEQEIVRLEALFTSAQTQAADAEAQVRVVHGRLHQAEAEIRAKDQIRQKQQDELTQTQVALATREERVTGLRQQHQQLARQIYQRRLENQQSEQTLASARQRIQDSQRAMLQASSILAHAFIAKEQHQREIAEMVALRDEKRQQRQLLAQQAQAVRSEWRVQQEHVHNREMEAKDLRHQRDTLIARLREDYQLELAELYQQKPLDPERPALDMPALNEEVNDLRKKLSRLGSVNLEALQELQELEVRATTLQAQWNDLIEAKKSLEEIIGKINVDSKRLFTDTFAVIRTHFQELFRKLFGGGMADIVLEDENDILDCGIEIIARPPGKELRSISLMSGGEKTMTAVALLLAIFRSKPSPFCLLDEVDAALDEANIGRFTDVLREFLDQSQFIIVTHSKKTMACADVLYGITMQESGISKQVAVRFDDWVDEGAVPMAG